MADFTITVDQRTTPSVWYITSSGALVRLDADLTDDIERLDKREQAILRGVVGFVSERLEDL